ncbi:hypothetical protein ARALYDRAFT_892035 [Arabidopsis lyrata subsp. lyrata]|uniref:Auxin-responsive family protein n=1 Tax=Arabidopsis lyrata subsp. lyrata TaxID=81972 RepID=D7KGT9_ARALL|nr:hypothetical protein ARALYDRAFT_892035 [Arabidopsis lyrata subsp. lyrata]
MMNTKELLKMAKKWQQRAALKRKIISFQRPYTTARSSIAIENGCYVVYMVDKERFTCPIRYMSNSVFQEFLTSLKKKKAYRPVDQSPCHSILFSTYIRLIQRMETQKGSYNINQYLVLDALAMLFATTRTTQ